MFENATANMFLGAFIAGAGCMLVLTYLWFERVLHRNNVRHVNQAIEICAIYDAEIAATNSRANKVINDYKACLDTMLDDSLKRKPASTSFEDHVRTYRSPGWVREGVNLHV